MKDGVQVRVKDYQVSFVSLGQGLYQLTVVLVPAPTYKYFYLISFLVLFCVLSLWSQSMWVLLVYVQKMQCLLL